MRTFYVRIFKRLLNQRHDYSMKFSIYFIYFAWETEALAAIPINLIFLSVLTHLWRISYKPVKGIVVFIKAFHYVLPCQ